MATTHSGMLTKGITLKTGSPFTIEGSSVSGTIDVNSTANWTSEEILNVMEIPELGNEENVEEVEVTTLADDTKAYIPGLKDKNKGQDIVFKVLYSDVKTVAGLANGTSGQGWEVRFPDGFAARFNGDSRIKTDSAGVNAPVTVSLVVHTLSPIVFVDLTKAAE